MFENHMSFNEHRGFIENAIAELVVCGAAEKMENGAAKVISPLDVVERKKLRLIICGL